MAIVKRMATEEYVSEAKKTINYNDLLESPVSDKTLSIDGGFADAKVTGDKINELSGQIVDEATIQQMINNSLGVIENGNY